MEKRVLTLELVVEQNPAPRDTLALTKFGGGLMFLNILNTTNEYQR